MNFAHFCEFWCFSLGKQARFTNWTFVLECPCEKFMNRPLLGLVCRGHSQIWGVGVVEIIFTHTHTPRQPHALTHNEDCNAPGLLREVSRALQARSVPGVCLGCLWGPWAPGFRTLSFLSLFLGIPCVFPLREIPCFFEHFSLFSSFPGLFPKKQGKEGQGSV